MQRGTWSTDPLLVHGPMVVRAAALIAAGVPGRTISRRCGPGGPWQRLLPGIVLLHSGEPTSEQQLQAALLHGRENAILTGPWALSRHGLERLPRPGDVHILVPADRRVASTGFAHVERTRHLPRPYFRDGIPVAPVPRAVIDAARRLTDEDEIQAMMAESVQRRFCTTDMLAQELDQAGRTGTALPRRALIPLLAGARSVAEADAWRLWRRSGLPPGHWNVPIFDSNGNYLATPDFWCDEIAFAWEIDSYRHHANLADHRDTVARNARYVAAGIVVLQTLPSRLLTEPDQVLSELQAAFRTAQARPRPNVAIRRAA